MKIKILSITMKRSQVCFIVFIFFLIEVSAQSVLSTIGSANESFGARTASSTGEWSLWANPAGLVFTENLVLGSGVSQRQGIPLTTQTAIVALPTSIGVFGAGVSRLGDDLYREQMLSFAFSNKLEITALGVRADVFQLAIDGNQTRRAIGLTVGGIISASKFLKVGACARNINLPKWQGDEKLPVVLAVGVLFQPTKQFSSMVEVEKNTDLHPTYKAGFEYAFKNKFWLRTGVNLFPDAAFAGVGLHAWKFNVDYAIRYGTMPGYHHQLSFSISFTKKSAKR